jgi:hypothetical protein
MLMLSLFCILIEILGLMTLADMRQNWHKLQHYPCLMMTMRHLRARFPRLLDVVLCCLLDMENCSPFSPEIPRTEFPIQFQIGC